MPTLCVNAWLRLLRLVGLKCSHVDRLHVAGSLVRAALGRGWFAASASATGCCNPCDPMGMPTPAAHQRNPCLKCVAFPALSDKQSKRKMAEGQEEVYQDEMNEEGYDEEIPVGDAGAEDAAAGQSLEVRQKLGTAASWVLGKRGLLCAWPG